MAYRHMKPERTNPRYLGPRESGMHSAPPTVTKEKRRVWHNFKDFMLGRRKHDQYRRRRYQRSTTHPQGFILPPYAFQSMGYPPPPPHMGYGPMYGIPAPHPMAYMPPPPPRAHDLNERSFMDAEFYSIHPESDLRSEYSHRSSSTRPGSGKNYMRDNHSKQPPFAFSGASPQEIEEYEAELPPPHRKRPPAEHTKRERVLKDDEEEEVDEGKEKLGTSVKGFDSFMMY